MHRDLSTDIYCNSTGSDDLNSIKYCFWIKPDSTLCTCHQHAEHRTAAFSLTEVTSDLRNVLCRHFEG